MIKIRKNFNKGFTPSLENGISALRANFRSIFEFGKKYRLGSFPRFNKKGRKFAMPFCSAGFTLIEMIVSLGVFTFVILIAMGSFLAILGAQKKAIAVGTLQENLRYSIETMLKDIRVGYSYYCGDFENNFGEPGQNRDCNNGGKALSFITRNDDIIIYRSNKGRIEKYKKDIANFFPLDESDFHPITFEGVNIENLKFFVTGSDTVGNNNQPDDDQPKVTLVITGTMGMKDKPSFSKFNVQTTVSQRLPDKQ